MFIFCRYVGKIVISSVMIGTAALAALVALIGVFLLDQLVVAETNWPLTTVNFLFIILF